MHEKNPQEHSIFIRFQSIIHTKLFTSFFTALRAPHFSSLTHSEKKEIMLEKRSDLHNGKISS
jgi:hypothetical protein